MKLLSLHMIYRVSMAVTKLILVRHGESQWNKENRFAGWYDVDLYRKGVSEAKAAGKLR